MRPFLKQVPRAQRPARTDLPHVGFKRRFQKCKTLTAHIANRDSSMHMSASSCRVYPKTTRAIWSFHLNSRASMVNILLSLATVLANPCFGDSLANSVVCTLCRTISLSGAQLRPLTLKRRRVGCSPPLVPLFHLGMSK